MLRDLDSTWKDIWAERIAIFFNNIICMLMVARDFFLGALGKMEYQAVV